MILTNEETLVKTIMLDKFNPRRLGKNVKMNITQYELIEEALNSKKSTELFKSMRAGLSWVNKIVVVPINELSDEERNKYDIENEDYKYVVIEGNTRVACLSRLLDNNTFIPVLVATRSSNEEYKLFLKERKRLQSISNVMVVKDWGDVQKAKQLYDSYIITKEINPEMSERAIFKELAENIGMPSSTVKKFIYRYIFYRELIEKVENIPEDDFKFFEIFEQNNEIRALFGWNTKSGLFIWEDNEIMESEDNLEEVDTKQELFYMMPEIIKISKKENINSKILRDIIRKNYGLGFMEIHRIMEEIIEYSMKEEYSYDSIKKYFNNEENDQEEEKLDREIRQAIKMLKNYPINQEFSCNYKLQIQQINKLSEKIMKCFYIVMQ